ncbi:MAG: hypothetical protein A2351_01175 [Omnitrophica bacterium RIFOXYB12_FULL_50_7]|nr:MAG: hypothetical protein A2351_01175 [Omnitrophica bacterium RIFOXYB12_FULL_50_7]
MKKFNISLTLALALLMVVGFGVATYAAPASNELVIADFDTGDKPNNIGGDFGGWDKDPNDESQGTQMSFDTDDSQGEASGYAIRLDYDVDSPNPAYNGFWMKLNGEDATAYNTLNFYVKGDAKAGYTKRFKIELKDMTNKPSAYIVSGVTDQWQKVSIPFEKFRRIENWNSLNELVFVFDDINSSPKTGSILIDQITFSKQ